MLENQKWYKNTGVITIAILAVAAGVAVWVNFVFNKPQNLSPAIVPHRQILKSMEAVDFKRILASRYETAGSDTETCPAGSTSIDSVTYGGLIGDGSEQAVVNYRTCFNGTGGGNSEVYALDAQNNLINITPDSVFTMLSSEGYMNGFAGHGYYGIQNSKLIFSFPIYKKGDANCCATGGTQTITFEWKNGRFNFADSHVTSSNADISNWVTFQNDINGFEVKYPPTLQTLPGASTETPINLYLMLPPPPQGTAAAHASLSFEVDNNFNNLSFKDYYKDYYTSGNFHSTPAKDIVNTTFHGKPAVDFKTHNNQSLSGNSYYVPEEIVIPMASFFIRVEVNDGENAFDAYQPNLINSILATFNFTTPHPLPYVAPSFKTYRNDKYGFSMKYPGDMSELQVFNNDTSPISFSMVAGDESFYLDFFDNPGQFRNPIYNYNQNSYDTLTYSTSRQQWVVTSNADKSVCPSEAVTAQGVPYYSIGTGIHAGDSFAMYVTSKGPT